MMDARIQRYADLLYEAERDKIAVEPLTLTDPSLTVDDAYAVQLCNVTRLTEKGQRISGKKIGLTSPGIQKQLGINEPDYGHLFENMDCPDGRIETDALLLPKIEAEIAFILKRDLTGENVTAEDVKNAADCVAASFEIVDSRIKDWRINLADTVADNASSGRYVLGNKRLPLDATDLSRVTMQLYKNGQLVEEGRGDAVLGDPCISVAWLANKLHRYGVVLKKGEVILSGAFTAAAPAAKGDVFEARFSDFGNIRAEFI